MNRVDWKNVSGYGELRTSRCLGSQLQGLDETYRFQGYEEVRFGTRPGDRSDSAKREMSGSEVLPGLELIEKSSYPSLPRSQPGCKCGTKGALQNTQLRL